MSYPSSIHFPTDQSAAARAVSLFSLGGPDETTVPGTHTMTLRLPLKLAAYVAVMASHADVSRNEMARLIIDAGVQEILSRTPDVIRAEIENDMGEQIAEFMNNAD